jgi:exopolyphosphatase/guanosine-5'-triphosphate,3'-diphosphate pyrophosphatase
MSAPAPAELSDSFEVRARGREAAVIDVGSNSVRLVIFALDGRAMTPRYNEKVTAALGRDLSSTGALSVEGAERALGALKRFAVILEAEGVETIYAVATAAVRTARDGRDFTACVARETGLALRILSGEDEARLAALGVLAGAPDAAGVVGDLGGSSLELVAVSGARLGQGQTFPVGHLALDDGGPFDYARIADVVDRALAGATALQPGGGALHAVGGDWRAIGRVHMTQVNHPLHVLQHYELGRDEALGFIELIRRQGKRSLDLMEEVAARRAASLPYAAVVLERLLLHGQFDRVILSAFGLREGVLSQAIDPRDLQQHALTASAEAFAQASPRTRAFGAALEHWLAPIFADRAAVFGAERDPLLRAAACRLADVGARLHPDQREEIMFDLVLRAPFAGITHAERAYLAAAIHHRYTRAPPRGKAFTRLLDDDRRRAAAALGAALRLGTDVGARSPALLASFQLGASGGVLTLALAHGDASLLSETAERRLETLAAALDLAPRIVFV